jgi:hypothetical protein
MCLNPKKALNPKVEGTDQGASTTYLFLFDRSRSGYFIKLRKKIALVPVALERLIRVHLPPMYTWLAVDDPGQFFNLKLESTTDVKGRSTTT